MTVLVLLLLELTRPPSPNPNRRVGIPCSNFICIVLPVVPVAQFGPVLVKVKDEQHGEEASSATATMQIIEV